ncbi:hypothetical protein [Spinactinospora alkalitolerans]|uniref:hypothetical protein n=1 Tax=Spinactinospora alkalitolerans TaxID=687207 RepID=UPI0031D23A43
MSRTRYVAAMLPHNASDNLVRTALLICEDCGMDDRFTIGIDLMLRGLDSYLRAPTGPAPGADTAL